jgi:hypothetical protein
MCQYKNSFHFNSLLELLFHLTENSVTYMVSEYFLEHFLRL